MGTLRFTPPLLVALGIAAAGLRAAEEPPLPPLPEFRQIAALPALKQAAGTAGIALEGVASLAERARMAPGDAVTALVSLTRGNELEQWAIELKAAEPDPKEKKRAPRMARFFSSSGYEFRFGSEPAPLAIRIVGPLEADDTGKRAATAQEVKRARVTVSPDYLGLGLERVPASMLRAKAARAANPNLPGGSLDLGPRPFPPETIAASRKASEAVGLMEADERAIAGSFLALVEFFQIAASTPGLQDVLKSVIDVPWWSILRSGGKMPAIRVEGLRAERALPAAEWGAIGTAGKGEVYAYPFQLHLNGKPALVCQLAVVAPRPPLLVSAGIIGLAAGRPDGKGPVLTLQLVATRSGGGEGKN